VLMATIAKEVAHFKRSLYGAQLVRFTM